MTKKIAILGSTGTIGVNTLDVIARHSARFEVFALTANNNVDALFEQCRIWRPRYAVLVEPDAATCLHTRCRDAALDVEVLAGVDALALVAAHAEVDYVMAGIVGAAGLLPNLAAAQAGKRVMLANKESLVMSGRLFMDAVRDAGAELLPIDSEHNAVFQCMPTDFARGLEAVGVQRILLTASGGPFRAMPFEQMRRVSPAQALAHPNWEMGDKITIDSATMMNKGLELIEAAHLFPVPAVRIEILVHPESVVHSMVAYRDGSVLAQLGLPDMRTPIAVALAWPERMPVSGARLDFASLGRLTFEAPDPVRFPALRLAREALVAGRCRPAVLNAANEVAVAAFLAERIGFLDIIAVVESTLAAAPVRSLTGLADVVEADMAAREIARGLIGRIAVAPTGTAH